MFFLPRKYVHLFFIFNWLLLSQVVQAVHWEQEPHQNSGITHKQFLDSLGLANAAMQQQCSKDGKHCSYWLQVGQQRFNVSKESSLIASTRYSGVTYAYYSDNDQHFIVNSHGQKAKAPAIYPEVYLTDPALFSGYESNYVGMIISKEGTPIYVKNDQLIVGKSRISLESKPLFFTFGTSLQGDWVLAMIDKKYQIHLVNSQSHAIVPTSLNKRSDLRFILSAYPTGPKSSWLTVFEYQNKRNKTLSLYQNRNGKVSRFTVANSVKGDVGVLPEIYVDANQHLRIFSNAKTNKYFYTLNPKNLTNQQPLANPYLGEDITDILIAAGVRATQWTVSESVKSPKGNDSNNLAKVKYQMNDSILTEFKIAGRVYGNHLSLSYLQNQAEKDMNSLEKAATKKLYAAIGLDRFFNGASTLRLEYASETAGGIATYSNNLDASDSQVAAFENDYKRFGIIRTMELGTFAGINYTQNNMPMAIGFFEQYGQPILEFDPDLKIKKLSFIMGYDTSQYSSRYLFNYRSFYFDGRLGLGIYDYKISSDILSKVKAETGKKDDSSFGFAMDGYLETGYIWQVRSVKAAGLGVSLQAGINADFEYYLNSISDNNDIKPDRFEASFERHDIRWGPFLRLNMIF